MPGEPRREPLRDLVEPPVAGFWGQSERSAACPLAGRVIRNADVPESRVIEAEDLPLRWFSRQEIDKAEVTPRDVVLVASGYIGKSGRIGDLRAEQRPIVASNFVRRLRPRSGVEPSWLYYLLGSSQAVSAMLRNSGGTTIANLSQGYLDDFVVEFVPGTEEQRRIAEILDTIDEAIRRTEQVIAKLQQMKQGMLHDLLTRGIDDNGELRDPQRFPDGFKETSLGLLPRHWDVQPVESLLAPVEPAMRSGPFGSALLAHELVDEGVPLLGIDNIHVELFVREFSRFVRPTKAVELSRYRVRPRDVMITIMGTVGRTALVPDDIGWALSSKHVWTLSFDEDRYSPSLACVQFNYAPWVLRHFRRDEQGGIMSAIRSETLRSALLPVPPPEEQGFIQERLSQINGRLGSEEQWLRKLRSLQQGVADDLLAGRVRVRAMEEVPA